MFRVRSASKEDRLRVFEALRSTQEHLDHVKAAFDAPQYPDETLIAGCSPNIAHQLGEFYASLTHAHRLLTEVTMGYSPDELTEIENEYPF